jgi:hypothetical protein
MAGLHAQSIPGEIIASHQLGFSGATVSVLEDFRTTQAPIAHRSLLLREPDGRDVTMALHDDGPDNTTLSLYKDDNTMLDPRGQGDEFLIIGARDCVIFDPIFMLVKACASRPPTGPHRDGPGLTYIGRFDWANGYDPPNGEFRFNWRFLPMEDGDEESF